MIIHFRLVPHDDLWSHNPMGDKVTWQMLQVEAFYPIGKHWWSGNLRFCHKQNVTFFSLVPSAVLEVMLSSILHYTYWCPVSAPTQWSTIISTLRMIQHGPKWRSASNCFSVHWYKPAYQVPLVFLVGFSTILLRKVKGPWTKVQVAIYVYIIIVAFTMI